MAQSSEYKGDPMDRRPGFLDQREAGVVRRNRRPLFTAGYVLGVVMVALMLGGLIVLIFHG